MPVVPSVVLFAYVITYPVQNLAFLLDCQPLERCFHLASLSSPEQDIVQGGGIFLGYEKCKVAREVASA